MHKLKKMMKRLVARAALVILLLAVILGGWAFLWEPRRVVVHEESAALPCWQGPPLRVAVVSDLHVGSPGNGLGHLDDVVQAINRGHPDLIVLLGDFVVQDVMGGRVVAPETIAAHLRPLRAPLGVHAVLGNHDWWLDAPRVARALRSADIDVIATARSESASSGSPASATSGKVRMT
jgi:predicted MPP superfamily phosphohydrolase